MDLSGHWKGASSEQEVQGFFHILMDYNFQQDRAGFVGQIVHLTCCLISASRLTQKYTHFEVS